MFTNIRERPCHGYKNEKNTTTKQNVQKLISTRILVVSEANKVSVQSYFRVLKVTITDDERVIRANVELL